MVKIVAVALLCACVIIYLKSINSELTLLVTVASGIILLSFAFTYLTNIFSFFNKLAELTGIDNELYKIIFKITTIGYLVEFGAGILNDFGLNSLAQKLIFAGKIIIFTVSIPIFYAVLNLITGLLQ